MRIHRIIAVLVFVLHAGGLLASVGGAGLDYPSIWRCDTAKFNWYCHEDETPVGTDKAAPAIKAKTAEEKAIEELERQRKNLAAKKALAVTQPTPENVKAYIVAQEAVMQQASVLSDVWRRVIWQNPDVNYEMKRPVSTAGINAHTQTRKSAEKQTLAGIAKEWGLFFFFRGDCAYCHRMAPTLKFLADAYGITVFPVSLDGSTLPDFPKPAQDNGMSRLLDVRQVPYVALGNIKDRRVIPLGSGVVAASDLVERIHILTQTAPGDLY